MTELVLPLGFKRTVREWVRMLLETWCLWSHLFPRLSSQESWSLHRTIKKNLFRLCLFVCLFQDWANNTAGHNCINLCAYIFVQRGFYDFECKIKNSGQGKQPLGSRPYLGLLLPPCDHCDMQLFSVRMYQINSPQPFPMYQEVTVATQADTPHCLGSLPRVRRNTSVF